MAQNALELYKRIKNDPDLQGQTYSLDDAGRLYDASGQMVGGQPQPKEQGFTRATFAPLVEYPDGRVELGLPNILAAPLEGLQNFGRYGYDTPEAISDNARSAFDVAGSMATGSLAATPLKPNNALGAMGGGIRAYHGSPYDFDKFDINKIGTGEGAQAFGHGLYFAENPEVANQYKKELSTKINIDDNPLYYNKFLGTTGNKELDDYILANLGDKNAIRKNILEDTKFVKEGNPEGAKDYQKLMADFRKVRDKIKVSSGGKTYEVNLNADPEEFLNWDKKITEKDLEKLSDSLEQYSDPHYEELANLFKYTNPDAMTGKEAYQWIGHTLADRAVPENIFTIPKENAPEIASVLKDAGFAGIKYLDRDSRNRQNILDQSTSNYVVFNPEIIDILRKYMNPPTAAIVPFATQGNALEDR